MDLQKLADESEIRALTAGYSDAVRRGDVAQAAATYCEDGVLVAFNGAEIAGRDTIREAMAKLLSPSLSISQTCEGALIEVDGDQARARWSVTEWIIPKEGGEIRLSVGVYEDTVVRTPEGWRFKRRLFHPLYLGPVSGGGKPRQDPVMEHTFNRPWSQ